MLEFFTVYWESYNNYGTRQHCKQNLLTLLKNIVKMSNKVIKFSAISMKWDKQTLNIKI